MKSDVGAAAYVPLWLVLHGDAPHGAIRLWALLHAAWTDRNGVGQPPREQLASDLNASVDTIDRWLKVLVTLGALTVTGRAGHTNAYTVHLAGGRTDAEGRGRTDTAPHAGNLLDDKTLPLEGKKIAFKRESKERSNVLVLDRFNQFWSKYPKKVRKSSAKRVWLKLKVEQDTDLWVAIMNGLYRSINMWESEKRESRYIPHAVRFLAERQWEDECEVAAPKPQLSRQSEQIVSSTERFIQRHSTEDN